MDPELSTMRHLDPQRSKHDGPKSIKLVTEAKVLHTLGGPGNPETTFTLTSVLQLQCPGTVLAML